MRVVLDFDDLSVDNFSSLILLDGLHDYFDSFKATLFAIPMQMSDKVYKRVQDVGYIQLAMHGWLHDTSMEAWDWRSKPDIIFKLDWWRQMRDKFPCLVYGFKAPGWWITPQTVEVLNEFGWWVGVNPDNPSFHLSKPKKPYIAEHHEFNPEEYSSEETLRLHGHLDNSPKNGIVTHINKLYELDKDSEFFWIDEVMND